MMYVTQNNYHDAAPPPPPPNTFGFLSPLPCLLIQSPQDNTAAYMCFSKGDADCTKEHLSLIKE
jgi:hypothetical protein